MGLWIKKKAYRVVAFWDERDRPALYFTYIHVIKSKTCLILLCICICTQGRVSHMQVWITSKALCSTCRPAQGSITASCMFVIPSRIFSWPIKQRAQGWVTQLPSILCLSHGFLTAPRFLLTCLTFVWKSTRSHLERLANETSSRTRLRRTRPPTLMKLAAVSISH